MNDPYAPPPDSGGSPRAFPSDASHPPHASQHDGGGPLPPPDPTAFDSRDRSGPPSGWGSGGGPRPAEHGGWRAVGLAAVGALGILLLYPWGFFGLVLSIAAVVLGVRTLRRASRHQGRAPGALLAVVAGGTVTLLGGILLAFVAAFHTEITVYQHCLSGANTVDAQRACQTALRDAITQKVGVPAR
ncbi:MAG: hypothetical protein ACYCXA_08080 [Actinomycetes bacterium]